MTEPLSRRLLAFIEANPGSDSRTVMNGVLDYRREKASDAERILIILINTGRIYTVGIRDDGGRLVNRFYAGDIRSELGIEEASV